MSSFRNAHGEVQQLPLAVSMYAQAGAAGMSLPDYLNREHRTDAAHYGSVFEQVCASEGIFIRSNAQLGIRASTLDDILNRKMDAAVTTTDSVPASRIIYPAVFLQAMEDRLIADMTTTPAALDSMIAISESIAGDRYEQPLINFTNPSGAVSLGVSQLSKPTSMLTITVSDKARTVPSFAMGLEISDQAIRSQTLDLVTLSLSRQTLIERNTRANGYILALLSGDVDNGDTSLSAAGRVATTTSYDSAATGGVITQKAWVKFLANRAAFRTITHVVGDLNGALAIENRTGKPIITTDNAQSRRINTEMEVINPQWPTGIKYFLTLDPAWTPGMLMGLDSRYAIRRVRNLLADYTSIEAFVTRRATVMRFDFGETVSRLYTDSFDCLNIA